MIKDYAQLLLGELGAMILAFALTNDIFWNNNIIFYRFSFIGLIFFGFYI